MTRHYTKLDIEDLKTAVACLRRVQCRIEVDGDAYAAIDDLMRPIEEMINDLES